MSSAFRVKFLFKKTFLSEGEKTTKKINVKTTTTSHAKASKNFRSPMRYRRRSGQEEVEKPWKEVKMRQEHEGESQNEVSGLFFFSAVHNFAFSPDSFLFPY